MEITKTLLLKIIKEEIDASLAEKDMGKEFDEWDDDQASSTWETMGGDFEKVRQSATKFAKDPAAYASALHKRVVGSWPAEHK